MSLDLESTAAAGDTALPEGRPRTTLDLAAAKLRTALVERSGYVIVTAESAQAAEALFAAVEPRLETFRTLRTSGRTLDPEAVVRALWGQGEPPFPARVAMRALIDDARAAGRPIVVGITEADEADPARLERVRLTLEGAPDASEIVHIALLGGPALIELLRKPETRAVALRIGATVQVPAITADLMPAAREAEKAIAARSRMPVAGIVAVAVVGAWLAWRSVEAPPPPAPVAEPAAPVAPAPPIDVPAAVPAPEPVAAAEGPSAQPTPTPATPVATAPDALAPAAPVPAPPPVAESVPVAKQAPWVAPAPRASVAVLQLGAFVRAESAEALRAKLSSDFPAATVSTVERGGTTYHRVRIGGFASEADVVTATRRLRAAGYAPARVRD